MSEKHAAKMRWHRTTPDRRFASRVPPSLCISHHNPAKNNGINGTRNRSGIVYDQTKSMAAYKARTKVNGRHDWWRDWRMIPSQIGADSTAMIRSPQAPEGPATIAPGDVSKTMKLSFTSLRNAQMEGTFMDHWNRA